MIQSYTKYITEKKFLLTLCGGIFLLGISLVANYFASVYSTVSASNPVTDIILSNTRVWNVDGIFVYGAVLCFFLILLICFSCPQYTPFILKSWAIFILIRSIFVILTHIGPFPTQVAITSVFFQKNIFYGFFTGNDLFFSGHTGAPFLVALIFWDNNKTIRNVFLAASFVFAVVVLLGHLHYSIDVLSAFFITYSIYHICLWMFKKDRQLFLDGDVSKL
jgi:hypothetical protein